MKKEIIGDSILYLADCKQILSGLDFFDICVTDPPYGIGMDGQKKSEGNHGGRKEHKFLGWDKKRPRKDVFNLIRKKTKHQIIWGGNYFADYLPATSKWLVWDKGQRIKQSDGELAWTSFQGALRIISINRMQIQIDQSFHPTQKPLPLIDWCLGFMPESKTVLDPFMGSGTTGVAALRMGKKFVGIEKEPEYFEIACKRIRETERQGAFFRKPEKSEQLKLIA